MTSSGRNARDQLPVLARAALLGAATGGRSSSGAAGLTWTAARGDAAPLDVLAGRGARAAATAFAVGEGLADKLPVTPSRLTVGPLAGRVVLGALAGIGLAARSAAIPFRALPLRAALPSGVVGGAAALGGAYAGAAWRRAAPFGSDLPAALIEDALVAALSWGACRR